MKNQQEETPWNYCDYRCELCRYQESCDVFHALETQRKILSIEGKDPDDLEAVLNSVAATLANVNEGLREEALKLGIDPDALAQEAEKEREPRFKADPLYREARELTLRTLRFIQAWRAPAEVTGAGAPSVLCATAWENLTWHHTLFSAKIARALSGLENAQDWPLEYGIPDYRISAGIASKSIFECRRALDVLAGSLPGAESQMEELRASFQEISDRLRVKFDPRM